MKIADRLNGKKILIWGYGREGKSTEAFIKSHCSDTNVTVFEGKYEDFDEKEYDLIIKSPGIRFDGDDSKMESQTSLFLAEFSNQIVGVTGTKGKSTTSSMLYYVLSQCGKDTVLVGNIGAPCLDYYDSISPETIIVYEMSCHQLKHTKVSPHIAVFLNLFEDHLDYYDTMDNYYAAKKRIVDNQKEDDICILGNNVPMKDTEITSKCIRMDMEHLPVQLDLQLQGVHNQFNGNIVYLIAHELLGCANLDVKNACEQFKGLAHRMEKIGEKDGVIYYDDSISTICASAIQAATGIPNVGIVLIGGMDRGINYKALTDFISSHKKIRFVCMYASGKRVYESLCEKENCILCSDLEEAVKVAVQVALPGEACVLSPAAASYGYFKNFEERGDKFKELLGF